MTTAKFLFIILLLMSFQITEAETWNVSGFKISSAQDSIIIQVDDLSFSQSPEKINNIQYQCFSSIRLYPLHKCDDGNINFYYNKTKYKFKLKGWFDFGANQWEFELSNTEKNLSITHSSMKKNKIAINLKQMPIEQLSKLVKDQLLINNELTTGLITANIDLSFENLFSINGNYHFENFNWESETSEHVLAETNIHGEFLLRPLSESYELLNRTTIDSGEGLFKDIYLVFEKDMFTVNSVVEINNKFELTDLEFDFELAQENNIDVEVIDLNQLNMNIEFSFSNLSVLYDKYLTSYLSIIGVSDAEIEGEARGKLALKNGKIDFFKADVLNLYMEIDSKKVEVNNLNSSINWQQIGDLKPSVFKWDGLLLAGMPINQSQLKVMAAGQNLVFEENTKVPVFDGSIDIYELNLKNIFHPEINIQFEGEVQPISLGLITAKMGWPIMNGYISGKIPGMKKIGTVITFDGLLELSVFDGTMQIEDLSIERLFGIAPVIAADIKFQNLSLLQITSTYDFGDITGNVNGFVNGMRVTNWKADRLDAYFESVKTKGLKQLISQRAIDNISSIGGVQGALSRSFLRFFDAFRYKKLGIGCTLRNSICVMKGIKSAANNYQIVKGSGLPSINIFGYHTYIDWQIFLDRLLNAKY